MTAFLLLSLFGRINAHMFWQSFPVFFWFHVHPCNEYFTFYLAYMPKKKMEEKDWQSYVPNHFSSGKAFLVTEDGVVISADDSPSFSSLHCS